MARNAGLFERENKKINTQSNNKLPYFITQKLKSAIQKIVAFIEKNDKVNLDHIYRFIF